MKKYSRGMVFGVFDLFHEGHKNFLIQAMDRCEKLIVVVAPSEVVHDMKGFAPHNLLEKRILDVQSISSDVEVISGDRVTGTWDVLAQHLPDVVFLGYDQSSLAEEMRRQNIPTVQLSSHMPEVYKSSISRKHLHI